MAKPKMPALQLWVYNQVLGFEVEHKHEKIEMVDAWWDFYSKGKRLDRFYGPMEWIIGKVQTAPGVDQRAEDLDLLGSIVASVSLCCRKSVTVGILPRCQQGRLERKINQTSGTEMREDTQLCPRDLDAGIRDCQVDVSFVAIDETIARWGGTDPWHVWAKGKNPCSKKTKESPTQKPWNQSRKMKKTMESIAEFQDEISQSRIVVQCVGTQYTAPNSPEIERELIWDAADGSNSRDNDLASTRVVKRLESSNF
ncbi:hypothetical protein SELMODRAFT_413427 [Selaginella moellendorffii]|uniref:Uncharacterized protein n=1 Tax=Selaginella moellendorffii TaxID=88036 RepID=D8RPF3_SELML|nr:hypothetical protein SELMODRAFT_413427 [Selaginella moellendorffii]